MWKKSEVWKNRKFQILLLAELLLLCVGLVGIFRGSRVVCTQADMEITVTGGEMSQETDIYQVDGTDGVQGQWLMAKGFSLTPGVYELTVTYSALDQAGSRVEIVAPDSGFQGLKSNPVYLYSGLESRSFQFYVTDWIEPEDGLQINVEYTGAESMSVSGIEIVQTTGLARMFVTCVLAASLLINSLVMLYFYLGKYSMEPMQNLVWFGIPLLALLASFPIFVDYIITGADSVFHLLRIEFLADALGKGIFPVRVAPAWIYGHGYASSLFYCDTFLVFPALLRLIGFSMTTAYNLYILGINLATAVIAYVSFRGMFRERSAGLLGSMLYTLAPYRIYNIYNRSAVGEYTAMTFLPLVCYGFWLLLGADTEEAESKKGWLVLMLGMSGIVQSHVLSAEIVAGFAALLCLVCIRRVFQRHRFFGLLKAVGGTVLLNLWFVLPMLDMMLSGKYKFSQNQGVHIQSRGTLPAHLFYTVQNAGANSRFHEYGMVDTEPIGIGIAMLIGAVVFLFLRKEMKQKEKGIWQTGAVAFVVGAVALVVSLSFFPWDSIQSWNRITGTLVPMIQFPTRLTTIPTICFVVVACAAGSWILKQKNRTQGLIFFGAVTLCCIFFSLYQTNDTLDTRKEAVRLDTMENAGTSGVLGEEYLFLESSLCEKYHDVRTSEGVQVSAYEKENLDTVTTVKVAEDAGASWMELPVYCYKGYQAKDVETGESLPVELGENAHVRIPLEAGYEGTVQVRYIGMWYWKVAEAVSLVFGLSLVGWKICNRRKKYIQ